jgi:3'-phosphoadenosine 5'-phosphosulfate sulfotransferase (PAPS reductase)/FAD synthetase
MLANKVDDQSADNLSRRLEEQYYRNFLPLIFTRDQSLDLPNLTVDVERSWCTRAGNTVVFLPPPPKIKDNPTAKPERLGQVIKRLAWCYRQDLDAKIAMANEVLSALFAATGQIAIAFSGGRDSLVALHLALQIKQDVTVVLVNTSIEFPESLRYIRELAAAWQLNYHEARAQVNFWALAAEQGLPVAGRGNTTFMRGLSEKADVKLSNSCCRRMKETPARQFYREHGIEGVVTGLRVSESLMRKLNFADYGALRFSSTYNTLIAWPLYAWYDEDIDAYIERHGLPRNPLYDMGYERVGCWACMQDMLYPDSRLFTLQTKHPQLYATIRKKFGPEMMRLLTAWAELDEWDFNEQHLDGLYKACSMEMLDDYRRAKHRKDTPNDEA